jgi:hypothetical protein
VVRSGLMMASTVAQLWRSGGGGRKGLLHTEGAPFIAARGGWQWRREFGRGRWPC